MSIRSHEREILRSHLYQDTVHHRTQIIICSGENRTGDPLQQHTAIRCNRVHTLVHSGLYRIILGTLSRHGKLSLIRDNLHLVRPRVNIKRQGLFRELFQNIQQQLRRDRDTSRSIQVIQLDLGLHGRFLVRCRGVQRIILGYQQNIIQNRLCGFSTNHLTHGLQPHQKTTT